MEKVAKAYVSCAKSSGRKCASRGIMVKNEIIRKSAEVEMQSGDLSENEK